MTQPFACGTAFAVSVLDSLMSTVCNFLANAVKRYIQTRLQLRIITMTIKRCKELIRKMAIKRCKELISNDY